jgi:hypothetical protein
MRLRWGPETDVSRCRPVLRTYFLNVSSGCLAPRHHFCLLIGPKFDLARSTRSPEWDVRGW